MDSFYIYIFSAAVSFVGRRLISLGGDKACAYLNVHTLHRISDIDLNQCILSLAGMNAVVCALTDFFRNWESKQPRQNSKCKPATITFKTFQLSHPIAPDHTYSLRKWGHALMCWIKAFVIVIELFLAETELVSFAHLYYR